LTGLASPLALAWRTRGLMSSTNTEVEQQDLRDGAGERGYDAAGGVTRGGLQPLVNLAGGLGQAAPSTE